jgi:hypothetical protein
MPAFFSKYLHNLKEPQRQELASWMGSIMRHTLGSVENRIDDIVSVKKVIGKTIDTRMESHTAYKEALLYLRRKGIDFYNDKTLKGRSIKLGLFGDQDAAIKYLTKVADAVVATPKYKKSSGRLGMEPYIEDGAQRFHFYAK